MQVTIGPNSLKWTSVIWMTFDMWADERARMAAFYSCTPEDAKPGTSVVIRTELMRTDDVTKRHQVRIIGYAERPEAL